MIAAQYDSSACGATLEEPHEETAVEPISRWQQPISLAQGILSLIVTGIGLFALLFSAHARFLTLEIRYGEQDKTLQELRKGMVDRAVADDEFKRTTGIQLERLATQMEWQAAWIKSGGEQRNGK